MLQQSGGGPKSLCVTDTFSLPPRIIELTGKRLNE